MRIFSLAVSLLCLFCVNARASDAGTAPTLLVSGTVVDTKGTPIRGVRITVAHSIGDLDYQARHPAPDQQSTETGAFLIDDLRGGSAWLFFAAPGYVPVDHTFNASTTQARIVMHPEAVLDIDVRTSSGPVIAGSLMAKFKSPTKTSMSMVTINDKGTVHMGQLAVGHWEFSLAMNDGLRCAPLSSDVTPGLRQRLTLECEPVAKPKRVPSKK